MTDADHHLKELPHFRRVCGQYCRRRKIDMYSVKKYITELYKIFSMDAEKDIDSIHPPEFFHQCYCTLKRALVGQKESKEI